MDNMSSRQQILEAIRKVPVRKQASLSETEFENAAIYKSILPDAITCFKNELETISGKCIVVESESELFEALKQELESRNLQSVFCRDLLISEILNKYGIATTDKPEDFETMNCGITSSEFLIARTGSVMVSSDGASGRQMNVFPPVHFIIATSSQLVDYPEDALKAVFEKYKGQLPSTITTITGPSRTADIEKTLVLGAHGPKELIVLLMKN